MLGYNPALTKFYVFMLAGLFGTIAGILYAYYNQFVSPSNAVFATSGKGVLMAILGGIGTLIGPLVGAFIIVFIENVVSVSVERWPTLLGLLFIVTILFARKGLIGALSDAWYRWVPGARKDQSRRGTSPLEGDAAPTEITA
jgi:branched-chain amino acid transport system permease protein